MKEEFNTVRNDTESGKITSTQDQLIKSICKVLSTLAHREGELHESEAQADHMRMQREYNESLSAGVDAMPFKRMQDNKRPIGPEEKAEAEQVIEEGRQYYEKPSNATLILNVFKFAGSFSSYSTETKSISVANGDINAAVNLYRKESTDTIKFIHYDGILLELTSKAVLSEVGTGIEI